MKQFSMIVAIDNKNGFSKNNKIPWHLKKDFKWFNNVTTGGTNQNAIIMGRKTWETLPKKPLTNRYNIIISSKTDISHNDKQCMVVSSLDEALMFCTRGNSKHLIDDIFVIGGQQLYEEGLNHKLCKRLYITHIDADYGCDRFFPKIDMNEWRLLDCSCINVEGDVKFTFCIYERGAKPPFGTPPSFVCT